MKLRLSHPAAAEIEQIPSVLYAVSSENAIQLSARFDSAFSMISDFPFAGGATTRGGIRCAGTRPYPYLIFYRVIATENMEIYDHLVSEGVDVGGKKPEGNLSALLYHSKRFLSHGRAGWTLPEKGESVDNGQADGAPVQEMDEEGFGPPPPPPPGPMHPDDGFGD